MNKSGNSVWTWGDPVAPNFPEDLYDIAKSALFQDPAQPQLDEEVKFRLLELHVVPLEKDSSGDGGNGPWSKCPCRVFTHTGMLSEMQDEKCGTKKCHYAKSIDEALAIYAKIYSTFSKFHKTKKFLSRWIGSQVYRNQALESGLRDGPPISDEVARLVEYVWRETIGELREMLLVPYRKIGLGKVEKAEGILLQIKKNLEKNKEEEEEGGDELDNLNREFYELIPHRPRLEQLISNKRIIATKQELCQLIKDIVNVSESTDWSQRSSSQARYHAIQCFLSYLPPNHPEFEKIKTFLIETKSSEEPLDIKRIFATTRGIEEASFDETIGNNQLLFHGSRPATFLGILSRGLLLPKIVVEEYGGSRRDAGLLGGGIYFADRVSTAQQYSPPSEQTATRLLVVSKVALGNVKELYKFDMTLDQAPEGHHSTHGVSKGSIYPKESEFEDDEFVVYQTNQQCLRYLVEFTLPGETELELPLCETPQIAEGPEEIILCKQVEVESSAPPTIDLSDVECAKDPVVDVDAGLVSQNETSDSITLQAVHVRAKLLDIVAEVVVLQSYRNNSDETMEAKYVFPIDQSAAVCGFEAFINDKHVVGVVKEKEKAHREYRQAVEAGHGAYLMDEESPHVFSVSVGNLPPQADVLIKVTYVTELVVEGDRLAFNLLGTVAPWKRQEVLAKGTPSEGDVVDVELETIYKEQSIHIAVTMASKITSIESTTHSILVKQSDNKASVKLGMDSKLDEGFQLLIGVEEIHTPRIWIEETKTGSNDQAAMLVFYPELDVSNLAHPEMVLVMDSSNSMKGQSLEEAKKLLLLIVQNLPSRCTFNVVVFGTEFDELFPASQQKNRRNVKSAREFIKGYTVGQGGTDFWRPLQSQNLLKQERTDRNLFLVTDGHLNNEEATLRAVGRNRAFTRIFTCGVSATANRHLLAAVARHGGGAFEFFDIAAKSTWEKKIKLQVSRASQPAVTSVSVQWDQDGQDTPPLLQAPAQITSLFRKNRLIVYGLLQNFAKATLFAEINGKKVETVLSAKDQPRTEGNIIHKLAARAVIRDWEEGVLHADRPEHEAQKHELTSRIVELSIRHSIVTPMTSFIAVEERDEEEQRQIAEGQKLELVHTVKDLLSSEEVDQLPTLHWEEPSVAKQPEPSPSKLVTRLLQTANAAVDSYSFKTAEKYFSEAYEVAKEKLSHTQPLTLKVAHRFSKFCARVKRDMKQAFDLVDNASKETKKTSPAEVLETTVSEDFSKEDELDSLQQAVEWAEMCKIEMERQRDQPVKKAKRDVPSTPFASQMSQQDDQELSTWFEGMEAPIGDGVPLGSWQEKSDLLEDRLVSMSAVHEYREEDDVYEYREGDEASLEDISRGMQAVQQDYLSPWDNTIPEFMSLSEEKPRSFIKNEMEDEMILDSMEQNITMPGPILEMAQQRVRLSDEPIEMLHEIMMPQHKLVEPMALMMQKKEVRDLILVDSSEAKRMPTPTLPTEAEEGIRYKSIDIREDRMLLPEPFLEMDMAAQSIKLPKPMLVRQEKEVRYEPTEKDEYLCPDTTKIVEGSIEMPKYSETSPKPKRPRAKEGIPLSGLLKSLTPFGKKKKTKTSVRKTSSYPRETSSYPREYDESVAPSKMHHPPLPAPLPPPSLFPAASPLHPAPPPGAPPLSSATPPRALRRGMKMEANIAKDFRTMGSRGQRKLTNTERLLHMQEQDGSWMFFPGFDAILKVDHMESRRLVKEKLESELVTQGVALDIEGVLDRIFQLLATIMVCVHLETRLVHDEDPYVRDDVCRAIMKAKEFIQVSQTELRKILGFQLDWEEMGGKLLLTGKVE